MQSFSFTLIVDGLSALDESVEDALHERCADALLGSSRGFFFLDFDRESRTLAKAVFSAIADVESAGIGLTVVAVEPDDLVSASEIARRRACSREYIRKVVTNKKSEFPQPIAGFTTRAIWSWAEVAKWFERQGALSPDDVERAEILAAFGEALRAGVTNEEALLTTARSKEVFAALQDLRGSRVPAKRKPAKKKARRVAKKAVRKKK